MPDGGHADDHQVLPTADLDAVPDLVGRRVLHVVQKYSSGVGSAIAQYTRSLPEVEHHLLSGTAVDAEGDLAEQADFTSTSRMAGGHLSKVRRVAEVVRELQPDVVHAHSSHGGLYARLGVRRTAHPIIYTPHCYGFERQDVSAPVRAAFWLAEAALAVNTSAFAACADRERQLSRWPTRHAPRVLIPNIAPAATTRHRPGTSGPRLVAGGGRLCPQKDPSFFLAAVAQLRATEPRLRAVWLGDGAEEERAALEAGGIEVSGWMPRGEAMAVLAEADLYLHSALWEGFPLMVAEAAALHVPTLVRQVPSFADLPRELTVRDEADLAGALACLEDPAAAAANVSRWSTVLAANTTAGQRAALVDVYRGQLR
jgi:glycosyltransferase involved in cell wall biosynthesis